MARPASEPDPGSERRESPGAPRGGGREVAGAVVCVVKGQLFIYVRRARLPVKTADRHNSALAFSLFLARE